MKFDNTRKMWKLYLKALSKIIQNEEMLKAFLCFSGRLYKYDFQRQVLIFAQRPDAVAVASETLWKQRMKRQVKHGAKIITAFNEDMSGLIHLFDVTDTNGAEKTLPFVWRIEEPDVKDQLDAMIKNGLQKFNASNIAKDYVQYVVYSRTGTNLDSISLDLSPLKDIDYFEDFGILVSETAEHVLREIERSISYEHNNADAKRGKWYPLSTEQRRILLSADSRRLPESGTNWKVWKSEVGVHGRTTDATSSTTNHGRRTAGLSAQGQRGKLGESRADTGTAQTTDTSSKERTVFRNGAVQSADTGYSKRNGAERTAPEQLNLFGAAKTAAPFLQPEILKTPKPARQEVVKEVSETAAQEPHETQPVRQKESKVKPPAKHNYYSSVLPEFGGPKAKYQANVQAIRLLKQIEAVGRLATPEEQKDLAKYTGWGGIAQAFDKHNSGWAKEYAELGTLLDEEEYASARASTPNAHYTSPQVISTIYSALDRFGFENGRILEPSMGVGYFFSQLPKQMQNSSLTGVELDSLSGRIAKQLYQTADIQIQGFETTDFADNSFDAAVGNVPFGNYQLADVKYDQHHFLIHDYFFAKAINQVRAGGIVAFVTTKGTLDKENSTLRRYLAKRADLIGAIRLPNNAFMETANTQVTTDILFLQKRDLMTTEEPEWLFIGKDENGVPVNEYFLSHPQMVLGEMVYDKSMYGNEKLTACKPIEGKDLGELLNDAVLSLDANYLPMETEQNAPKEKTISADPNVRNFTYTVVDDTVYYRENSQMHKCDKASKDLHRIMGLHQIRLAVLDVIACQQERGSEEQLTKLQAALNTAYDEFVKEFGTIGNRQNCRVFHEDNDAAMLAAMEETDSHGNVNKADIFLKRTIKPAQLAEHADHAQDALTLCINSRRSVDFAYLQQVYPKSPEEIREELGDSIYLDPLHYDENHPFEGWQTADEYLSGNVREKLKIAQTFSKQHPEQFTRNVQALTAIQPKDLDASEIEIHLGTPWLDREYLNQFLYQLLETPMRCQGETPDDLHVIYNRYNGSWSILNKWLDNANVSATSTYGTNRKNAYEIIEDTLNLRSCVVKDAVDNGNGGTKYVVNSKQTMLARGKQEIIKSEFKTWLFRDEDRRHQLVNYYNEHFNNTVPRRYDGSRLLFPGMNPQIKLRPHQLDAVARCISGNNTLLAHVVGAGKTFTMIAAAHEQIRLGLAGKAAFIVPNHLTEQFGSDIYQLYPDAKVLISTKADFQTKHRQRFLSRIAMSDVEFIVMGHSQFEKIPMSPEHQRDAINRQVEEITSAIEETRLQRGQNYSVKQLESQKKSLETQLKRLLNDDKKDKQITFEQLGIDSLFVDEAHYYKNLAVFSKMRNVAGISNTHAKKASDLLMKLEYLGSHDGISGIATFATGTPLSNSMTELYVMQKYLQPQALRERGIFHFDDWAAIFGETVTAMELAPEGNGYRPRTRFSKFHNLPELMTMFREIADIQTADMLNLPTPKLVGGKPIVVKCKPSFELEQFMMDGLERVERIRNGAVSPTVDNMLKFTTDAKKSGLDMRLIDPACENDPNGKIAQCAKLVTEHYTKTQEQQGVQLVFCDTSTPKKDAFDVYTDLKRQAVSLGIPEQEIAFIHDANTDAAKDALFAKCRGGEVRVLLGSTQKCGAGTNIQDRLIALHHLDCPYRPSDIEQREGRILRQGNKFFDEVYVYRYVTERSFDAYLWSIVETKARFISQVMTSKAVSRTCEDVDEAVLSYAEVKAVASGDPRIKDKLDADMQVSRLLTLKNAYEAERYRLEDAIHHDLPKQMRQAEEAIENIQKDIEQYAKTVGHEFQITICGRTYTEREPAGAKLLALSKQVHRDVTLPVGNFRGFDLSLHGRCFDEVEVSIKGEHFYKCELSFDAVGSIMRIENALKKMDDELKQIQQNFADCNVSLKKCQAAYESPFTYEQELKEQLERQATLNAALDLNHAEDELTGDDSEESFESEPENKKGEKQQMTVVLVEPGRPARIERMRGELRDMQKLVGGSIETVHPFDDNTVLICNEEGKLEGLPPNRTINKDVIAGTFFICAETPAGDDFTSLDRKQLKEYLQKFQEPETFDFGTAYAEPLDC